MKSLKTMIRYKGGIFKCNNLFYSNNLFRFNKYTSLSTTENPPDKTSYLKNILTSTCNVCIRPQKNEFHFNSKNSEEIEKLRQNLYHVCNSMDLLLLLTNNNKYEFLPCLYEYISMLETLSLKNFNIIYEKDQKMFKSILDYLKFEKIKFDETSTCVTILKFLYVLDYKKVKSLNRYESDLVLPKILNFYFKNITHFSIDESLEVTMILSYFGLYIDLSKFERKLDKEIDKLSCEKMLYVMKGLFNCKNNRMNNYKTKIVKILLPHFIRMSYTKSLSIKESSDVFQILTGVGKHYPLVNLEFKFNIDNCIRQLLSKIHSALTTATEEDSSITLKTISNILKGILNLQLNNREQSHTYSFNDIMKLMYVKMELILQRVLESKLRSNTSYLNLPLLFITVKIISQIEGVMPERTLFENICKFVNKEIPFYTNKNIIIKESLYLLTLSRNMTPDIPKFSLVLKTVNTIINYITPQMHFVNINEYPVEDFLYFVKTCSTHSNLIVQSILDSINCTSTKNETTLLLSFDLFVRACYYSRQICIVNGNFVEETFRIFSEKLENTSPYDKPKVCMNILSEYVNKCSLFIPIEYKIKILRKILNQIDIEEVTIFQKNKYKLFLFLVESQIESDADVLNNSAHEINTQIKNVVNELLKHVILIKDIFKGLRIIIENNSVNITNKTINVLLDLVNNSEDFDKDISSAENLLFIINCCLRNQSYKISKELLKALYLKSMKSHFKKTCFNHKLVNVVRENIEENLNKLI